jgi:hypothetical protein
MNGTIMTATKTRRTAPLNDSQLKELTQWIVKNDFDFWFRKKRVADARNEASVLVGGKVTAKKFAALREDLCKWWKKRLRRQPSREINLAFEDWQRLRAAVKASAVDIQGRTIDEAVAVVSLRCRCNATVLRGLTSELHFWK